MIETKIQIGEVEGLLAQGKKVLIKTVNDEFVPITHFINKGLLKTFRVELENKKNIKVTESHKFFTDSGWLETKNIIPLKHSILCEDGNYSLVKSINNIGIFDIVDITVDHPEQCYFGNGMLNHNSGKSLLGAYALANTQKKGGVAVYIDTESAVTKAYMEAIGVDVEKLIYLQLETLEDIFTAIEEIITKVRSSNKNKLVTILIDSVMGATTNKEHDSDFSKDGYATDKALILSKAMRKITNLINKQKVCLIITNQLRQKLGVTFGQQYTTSGGKAIGFHSSVRVRLSAINKIKIKTSHGDEVIGIRTQAEVFKNRLGPPLKKVEYDIYFNSGIDNFGSWLTMLKTYKVVSSAGQYYTLKLDAPMDIVDPTSAEVESLSEIRFTSKLFAKYLETNPKLKEHIYNLMCNELIVKYVLNEDFSIDEVEIDRNVASILDED